MWFGTDQGIYHRDGSQITDFITSDMFSSLPTTNINDIAFDSMNDLWLATSRGVVFSNGEIWKTYNTSDGLTSLEIRDIVTDPNGIVWIRSLENITDTIYSFEGGRWTPHNFGDIGYFINFLPDGSFGSWDYNIHKFKLHTENGWELYPGDELYFPQEVIATSDSNIWVLNNGAASPDVPMGLFHLEEDKWKLVFDTKKFPQGIALSPSGYIWLTANKHLLIYKDGDWVLQTSIPEDGMIWDMKFSSDGTLWVLLINNGHIWKYKNDTWQEFPLKNIDPGSMYFAPDGAIWFTTSSGLARFSER